MNVKRGFTVIELIIVIALLAGASLLFFTQKHQVEVAARDDQRKTAINAMYYSLEEVYYKANKSYPRTINAETLPSVAPELFKDPNGIALGEGMSNYRYEAFNCNQNACKGYTIRTSLEKEADFVKESRNK